MKNWLASKLGLVYDYELQVMRKRISRLIPKHPEILSMEHPDELRSVMKLGPDPDPDKRMMKLALSQAKSVSQSG